MHLNFYFSNKYFDLGSSFMLKWHNLGIAIPCYINSWTWLKWALEIIYLDWLHLQIYWAISLFFIWKLWCKSIIMPMYLQNSILPKTVWQAFMHESFRLFYLFVIYEGCSKWIAYFYLETLNFKLAQKCSFHALEVLPVARNAKFQPMYPLLEGVTVRWFGHSNKVLMNGRSKCLSGLVFPSSKEWFQFPKQKEITWGKVWGIRGVRQNSYFFFLQKRRNYCGGMSGGIVM